MVEAELPEPEANTWPLFEHEAAESHRETFPSRADEYGFTIRRSSSARRSAPDEVEAAYNAVAPGAATAAQWISMSSPCVPGELPAEDVDERDVRFQLSG